VDQIICTLQCAIKENITYQNGNVNTVEYQYNEILGTSEINLLK